MENIYSEAIRLLENGQNFVMATIIDSGGSTPRSAGSKMIVRQDGSIFDTIGGGKLEAVAMAKAREVLANKKVCLYRFDLSAQDVAGTEMICGGKGAILLDYVTGRDLKVYQAAQNALATGRQGWLTTVIDDREGKMGRQFGFVAKGSPQITGDFEAGKDILAKVLDAAGGPGMHSEEIEGVVYYTEPVHSGGAIYLFGAGHVAREVAKVAAIAGFETIVFDDRKEFANSERFPASECRLLSSFNNLPELYLDDSSYVVIVTRGHLYDRVCLKWALATKAGYIGMIGSRKKRDLIYAQLLQEGVPQEALQRVYAPIGLNIGAETPAEIAVSIVAELIKVRAEKNGE